MAVTRCRIVEYKLTEGDVSVINSQRGGNTSTGNAVQHGDVLPAIVVRVFDTQSENPPANLKVFLDGKDDYWATSRVEGTDEGQWTWPARA